MMIKTAVRLCLLSGAMLVSQIVLAGGDDLDCDKASTTFAINQCAAQQLQQAEAQMADYLAAAIKHHHVDKELVAAISDSQTAWLSYREVHCDAVYTQWRDGTIRGLMALSCKTALTQQRTSTLWQAYLTFLDSTAPILPEPAK
ncbi:lysozyme inhibitor LprI family protein [Pseudoalteromonas fenneropenaei]|uniref:Lysozyme inhibitor LprI family protein n=1 Tax=Pseudoalteromonas fenneropenaei TaxID=1737459 RepID=A0ABV7CHJ6_9GAMM